MNNKTILLVEDEVLIAMSEQMTLEQSGYRVLTVGSGEDAIDAVRGNTAIDLILMDIDLGNGIDGTEAAAIILQERDLPVVFLSSHTEPEIVAKTEKITSYGYIVKGLSDTILLASIKMAFRLFDAKSKKNAIERALRESEDQYSTVVQNATVAICVVQDNRFRFFNPEATRLFGYTAEEMTQLDPDTIIHPDDRERVVSTRRQRLEGREIEHIVSHRIVTRDQAIRWVEIRAVIIDWNARPAALVFLTDITERQLASEAVQESEATVRRRLQAILEPESDIGSFELSDIIDRQDLQLLMDDFYRLTGVGGAVVDIRGNVLVASGWQDICTQFHRVHPQTRQHCIESDTVLTSSTTPGEIKRYKCKNNMWDAATPIHVAGRHIGNVFYGQFFFEDEELDYHFFRRQAKRYGFDESSYLAALDRVPRWHRQKIDQIMSFYAHLAAMISTLGYRNIHLARTITARDRLLVELRESEELLDDTQRLAGVGGWVWDLERRTMNWTAETYRIHGINPGDIPVGSTEHKDRSLDCYDPADRQLIETAFGRCIEEGLAYDLECQLTRLDGSRIWIRTMAHAVKNGDRIVKVVGNIIDITQRKQMEAELRANEEKYRFLLENIGDVVWTSDLDFNITYVSPSCQRLVGYTAEERKQQRLEETIVPASVEKVMTCLDQERVRETAGDSDPHRTVLIELEYYHKNGSTVWVENLIKGLRNTAGEWVGFYGVSRDITERREAAAALRRQLSEKEILLRETHHRIKNNIASVAGLLSLQSDSVSSPEARSALKQAIGRLRGMATLYDKMLLSDGFQQISAAEYLGDLTDSVIALFTGAVSVTVERRFDEFRLDTGKAFLVGIILNELLTNAMKYAFAGRDTGHIDLSLSRSGNRVTLVIDDNGTGLPDGFDVETPTQFGLMLVRMLADQLDGTFLIESVQGTRAVLNFENQ
jgi:PAS domain S-box-containing protein